MRAFTFFWILAVSLLPSIAASVPLLPAKDYDVFIADINGDATVDILLRPKSSNSIYDGANRTLAVRNPLVRMGYTRPTSEMELRQ